MLAHVLGPHSYLLGGPRSKNMQFMAILLSPICQSRPKMGQNSQNHNFECKNDIFGFNGLNTIRKQYCWVYFAHWGVKIALFGSKMASFGPWVFFLSDAKHLIFFALSAFSYWFCFPLYSDQWTAKQGVSWWRVH